MNDFTGVFDNNPGLTITANRNAGNGNLGPLPLLLPRRQPRARRRRAGRRRSRRRACPARRATRLPIDRHRQRQHLRSEPAGAVLGHLDGRLPARARPQVGDRECATSARAAASSGRRSTTTRRTSSRTASSTSSSSRRPTCRRNIAAGCGGTTVRARSRTADRARHVPLPIYLALLQRRAGRAGRCDVGAATRSTANLDELELREPAVATTTRTCSRRPARMRTPACSGTSGAAGQRASRPGCRANFFRANPDMLGGANVTGQRRVHAGTTRCSCSSAAGCRTACSSTRTTPSARR